MTPGGWRAAVPAEKILWLYVAMVPVMRGPALPVFGDKLQGSDLVFLALLAAWGLRALKSGVVRLPPAWPAAAFLVAAFSLAAMVSRDRLQSGVEVAGIAYLAAMYLVVVSTIDSPEAWARVALVWLWTAVAVSALGLLALIVWAATGERNVFVDFDATFATLVPFFRPVSTFRHPNMLAAYLHASLVVAAVVWLAASGSRRRHAAAATATLALALVGTVSRLTAGGLVTAALLPWPSRSTRPVRTARAIVVLAAAAAIALATLNHFWLLVPVSVSRAPGSYAVDISFSRDASKHIIFDETAWRMLRSEPWVGVGPGLFPRMLPQYLDRERAAPAYRAAGHGFDTAIDPHSTFLGWAAETGAIGLAAMVVFFVVQWRTARAAPSSSHRRLMACFSAGLAGFLVNAWQIDILTMRHFWLMLAMGASLARLDLAATAEPVGESCAA